MSNSDPVHHNLSAYHQAQIAQGWFQPSEAFFNSRSTQSSHLSLTLPPGSTRETPAPVPAGVHEASPLGSFSNVPSPVLLDSYQPYVSSSSTLSPNQVAQLLEIGTSDSFFTLFLNGHIMTLIVGGYHAFQCPHCNQPIKTSIPSTVLLGNSGHFNALTSHYRRKPCIIALSRKEHEAAVTILEITSPALLSRSFTPQASSVVSRSSSFNSQFSLSDSDS